MPKVVVYVPQSTWRRLQERGLDPAAAVREYARRGWEISTESGTAAPPVKATVARTTPVPPQRPAVVPDYEAHFKPDFKKAK